MPELDLLSLALKVMFALIVLAVALVVGVTWGAALLDRGIEERQWMEE